MINIEDKNFKLVLFVSLACISILASRYLVFAQTKPEFLISWRALNYVPADFMGKIFPTKSSAIEVGFDLLDGNRIADLSRREIRWFLDNELLRSGIGLKTIRFNVIKPNGNDHFLRIAVLNYRGLDIEQTVTIPVASPEVVINTQKTSQELTLGAHSFQALPYFFNVNSLANLSFTWFTDNQSVGGEAAAPDFLNLNLESKGKPTETPLNISIRVQNFFNQLELAIKNLNLVIK